MGLTSAMFTGLSGLQSNQFMLDTIGNNVANVNTNAFKSSRSIFETQYYRTIRGGTAPDAPRTGGTNPLQVGLGSSVAAAQRDFRPGQVETTGVKTDVAVEGAGFFILATPDGDHLYRRDGAFRIDGDNTLVSPNGDFVQGYAADQQGNISAGALTNLVIPLGTEISAQATQNVSMEGNLDSGATVAGSGAVQTSAPLQTSAGPAGESTALTAIVDDNGVAQFADADTIRISGITKSGAELPDSEFTVGVDGTTLSDFADWLEARLGINTDDSLPGSAGVTVNDTGQLVVTSNVGLANAVEIDVADIRNVTSGTSPFSFTGTDATGQGVSTSMLVFDSLGQDVRVRLRLALESKSTSGNTWRFYAESQDDTDTSTVLGTGTITFDQNGRLAEASGTDLTINRADTGAADPLAVTLDFTGVTGLANNDNTSTLVMADQDGFTAGTLQDFDIEGDGRITGSFSNGQSRVLGQLALAMFTNPDGLVAQPNNNYVEGVNSGTAQVVTPGQLGSGRVLGGTLELSNVDLGREFIGLIQASTGFSAASRVITTSDEMLRELLIITR